MIMLLFGPSDTGTNKGSSPRARTLLFTFLRPKGLRVVSKLEFSVVFRNAILTKIHPCINAQISYEHRHLHNVIWLIFNYPISHSRHFIILRNTCKAPIHQYKMSMNSVGPLLSKAWHVVGFGMRLTKLWGSSCWRPKIDKSAKKYRHFKVCIFSPTCQFSWVQKVQDLFL